MASSFVKFQPFVENLAKGRINLNGTLKLALSNTAPNATDNQLSQITQISNGNGYTTGGAAVTVLSCTQTGGTLKLVCADVTFTSVTGNMGPFRYAILYDDAATNDELIGYWDRGASITLDGTQGDQFVQDFDGTNGVLTIT